MTLPAFPKALGYIWRAYTRMRRRAAPGFAGPQPVTFLEIDAFMRLKGHRFAPWEIDLIEMLDDIYLSPDPQPTLPEGQTVLVAASASDAAGVRSVMASIGKGRRVVKRKGRAQNG